MFQLPQRQMVNGYTVNHAGALRPLGIVANLIINHFGRVVIVSGWNASCKLLDEKLNKHNQMHKIVLTSR